MGGLGGVGSGRAIQVALADKGGATRQAVQLASVGQRRDGGSAQGRFSVPRKPM